MSHASSASRSARLPRIGALGVALAGGLMLAGHAAAFQPLAIAAVSASATAEGKCGEGKCGANKAGPSAKAAGKTASKAKVGEGQCGEGKCGDASFARTDADHDGKVSRAEFLAVAPKRASEFNTIDSDHDGYISEQEAHDYLRATYQANGKPMPKGLFARVAD
ncbi:EF-hand domain-containing protein [Stenotrophomonas sp. 24(2023)]|uniref:HvfA family oxazolone/thioamide-modified RiPP metallophore n=1 Tax=Stenotrophomonas sp. 24(2023) TaxID=3068324 RepID=UPI0027DF5CBE|nr:EF-hand domain-containing protein [Stenotrophomonas sp. 24(2023)]WMJ68257.1 EF-hand domain-containing protein [Stenotrophomonas sp. 24(2023)]